MANENWVPNMLQIQKAMEYLGITWPVLVKQTGGLEHRGHYASHCLWDRGDGKGIYHHILVKRGLSVREASESLWHELTHALQAEQVAAAKPKLKPIAAWTKEVQRQYRRYGQQNSPIEFDARINEGLHHRRALALKPRDTDAGRSASTFIRPLTHN